MKYKFIRILCFTLLAAGIAACTPGMKSTTEKRYAFADILDISYTPDTLHRCYGWFTDAGSWMGFTLPERQQWVNGFCGPFSLDMFRRQWMAQSAAVVSFAKDTQEIFVPDSTCYYPGELYMSAHSTHGSITQRLNFTSASTALLRIEADTAEDLLLSGSQWGKDITVSVEQNSVIARHPSGETVTVTFTPNVELAKTDNNYTALVRSPRYPVNVAISFFTSEKEMTANLQNLPSLHNPFPHERAEIMPVEKAWPIREVVEILRRYDFTHQRRVSFEYIVMSGLNDSPRHIRELCRLLDGIKCRINLIRFHKIPGSPYFSPDDRAMIAFRDALTAKGIHTTIRTSRGEDIQAACGLLSTAQNEAAQF